MGEKFLGYGESCVEFFGFNESISGDDGDAFLPEIFAVCEGVENLF